MGETLLDLLATVANRFQGRIRVAAEEAGDGLTFFQAKTVGLIGRSPGYTQQELAARLSCDKAQMARAIKALEARSLIAREADAADWRASRLQLTAEGRRIFAAMQRLRTSIGVAMLTDLDAEERQILSDALRKIAGRLDSGS